MRLALASATAELVLELLDATSSVHEALFARVGRMGVHRHIADNDVILDAIDRFLLLGAKGGLGQKLPATGNVHEARGFVFGMNVLFHGKKIC